MTVELDGRSFTALNGGPLFTFNEAVSIQVYCESQAEVEANSYSRMSDREFMVGSLFFERGFTFER